MECPKCHSIIDDNLTVCPKCHKVIALRCPNCNTVGESPVCRECGYTILVKCSKCSRINHVNDKICPKCGFPVNTSLAYQECESDDFASLTVKFGSLKSIRNILKSKELYSKFYNKLRNILVSQIKNVEGKIITYGDIYSVNFNKELSLATSSNKAVRLAVKIINAYAPLNTKVFEEFGIPLNLNITITKKSAENLQELITAENNVKLLTVKKDTPKYLKGFQILLDQFVRDEINKDYKTDSLYTTETPQGNITYYEIPLKSYILPPSEEEENNIPKAVLNKITKTNQKNKPADIYSFKVFDINAKCSFQKATAVSIKDKLYETDLTKKGKIISVKSAPEHRADINNIISVFEDKQYNTVRVSCTKEMNSRPWGFFEALFRDYFNLSRHNKLINIAKIDPAFVEAFKPIFDLICFIPVNAHTPEDGRFTYMEIFAKFLSTLRNTAIIIEGFEFLDDTSLQTLELYFDNYKNIIPNFVFISENDISVHSKIKTLLRTELYTEFKLEESSVEECLATLKSDASDFINSFYFEKITENFNGSYLYFKNAIKYLESTGVIIDFENKIIIKSKKSVILPQDLKGLLKSGIKNLSKNADISFMFAYSAFLGNRIDLNLYKTLQIKDVGKNAQIVHQSGLGTLKDGVLYVNNFDIVLNVINESLKKEAAEFIAKSLLSLAGKGLDDSSTAIIFEKLGLFKEEYLTLWKNSQFAINTGDYDAYLKNCLKFLSLVEKINSLDDKNLIDENKKEVYNNILMFLYNYSPAKIYYIENVLLMDAINNNDDEKIVKLSNLMLQGALISANYTDALGLLHNILSRMSGASLIVDGKINTKFLLLSLVNIEIRYNIGDFKRCAEIADEILEVLKPEILDKIKPASFSINLFISHLLDTFRLAGFAKLYMLDDNLEQFFEKISEKLNTDLPDKDCIIAIKDFLEGKVYSVSNIESSTPFSKVVFLILQEFSELKDNYKRFAQNIYQAKLLANDIHQRELELFCDLMIASAYSEIGIKAKAESIMNDVLKTADNSAVFNIIILAKYLLAKLKINDSMPEEAMIMINDNLALIRKYNDISKILFALNEKLYAQCAQKYNITSIDIDSELQKIAPLKEKLKFISE